jgi:hypothetical protein
MKVQPVDGNEGRKEQAELLEMFNRAWDALTEDERREERAEREWLLAARSSRPSSSFG